MRLADWLVRHILIPGIGLWALQQIARELVRTLREARRGLWN